MGKMITLLLGAAVVFGIAYFAVTGTSWRTSNGEAPQKTLQNVRDSAQRIEDDAARRATENLNRASPE